LPQGTPRLVYPFGGALLAVSPKLVKIVTVVAFSVFHDTVTLAVPAGGHVKLDGTDTDVNDGSSGMVIPGCGVVAATFAGFVVVVAAVPFPAGVVTAVLAVPAAALTVVVSPVLEVVDAFALTDDVLSSLDNATSAPPPAPITTSAMTAAPFPRELSSDAKARR
jgi:hypothetical protein